MQDDIEKMLRRLLKEVEQDPQITRISLDEGEVREIMARFADYRARFAKNANKSFARTSLLQKEHCYMTRLLAAARSRLNDDLGNVGAASERDVSDTAVMIERIEKIRGRLVANRLLWGGRAKPTPEDYAEETLVVLQAAIDEARASEKKWREHLREHRKKYGYGPPKKATPAAKVTEVSGNKHQEPGKLARIWNILFGSDKA